MRIRSGLLLALLLGAAHNLTAEILYSMTDMGAGGGAINDAGQATGTTAFPPPSGVHAFLYSNGIITDLGTLGGRTSGGVGINNTGQVTGFSDSNPTSGSYHTFLYSNGQMTDLGTLGGGYSVPAGYMGGGGKPINDVGQVTGFSTTSTGAVHAFLYSNGQMMDLGTLGGDFSRASGVNNAGQVTGGSSTVNGATHAFLYSNGQMIDLGL